MHNDLHVVNAVRQEFDDQKAIALEKTRALFFRGVKAGEGILMRSFLRSQLIGVPTEDDRIFRRDLARNILKAH
jgi:hypothetical protein